MESKTEHVVSSQDASPQEVAKELPWVKCRHCLAPLAQVAVFEGWTRVKIANAFSDGGIRLVCPSCGTVRAFYSKRIS